MFFFQVKKNFGEWISRLSNHRLYRQHEINFGTKESPRLTEIASPLIETVVPIMASKLEFTTVCLNFLIIENAVENFKMKRVAKVDRNCALPLIENAVSNMTTKSNFRVFVFMNFLMLENVLFGSHDMYDLKTMLL